MTEKEEGLELNIALRLWCDKHEAQWKSVGANPIFMTNSVTSAAMTKIVNGLKAEDSVEAFADALRAQSKSGPACCFIGQEKLDEIIADAPVSTGDKIDDWHEAAYAVPGIKPLTEEDEAEMPESARKALEKFKDKEKK